MKSDGTKVLTSWKEIADHLDVTVRTAQVWEKQRGLPVGRMPGRRSRVYMRIDDYEAWLSGAEAQTPTRPKMPAGAKLGFARMRRRLGNTPCCGTWLSGPQ